MLKKDWRRVEAIARAIVEAETRAEQLRSRMIDLLRRLERKFGALPSIVATRAEYTERVPEKIRLLDKAYESAVSQGDQLNKVLISSSIARVFVEDLGDVKAGKQWLARLRRHLSEHFDKVESAEYGRLSRRLASQTRRRRKRTPRANA